MIISGFRVLELAILEYGATAMLFLQIERVPKLSGRDISPLKFFALVYLTRVYAPPPHN